MITALARHRHLIARRATQLGTIGLFVAAYRLDWKLFGVEPIVGNLSSSLILGTVPLADPFAVLQILASGHGLMWDALLGAALVAAFYFLVGGRSFCGWVCPLNMVTDAARNLRTRLRIPHAIGLDRRLKYGLLLLALALSFFTGVAAFEWVSPVALLQRELIFGMRMAWLAAAGIFLFDLLLLRNGWCGHLCPLGAFYALVGRFSPLRVRFAVQGCTPCGLCHRVCPEPQVLDLKRIAGRGAVLSGECTNCGNCLAVCPQNCFAFGLRWQARPGEMRNASPAGWAVTGRAAAPLHPAGGTVSRGL